VVSVVESMDKGKTQMRRNGSSPRLVFFASHKGENQDQKRSEGVSFDNSPAFQRWDGQTKTTQSR